MHRGTAARLSAGLVLGATALLLAGACGTTGTGSAGPTTALPASTSFRTIPITDPPSTAPPETTAAQLAAGEDPTPGGPDIYVVKAGDAWPYIARKLGVPTDALLSFNGATLKTPVYVGDRIRVPPASYYESGTSAGSGGGSAPSSTVAGQPTTPTEPPTTSMGPGGIPIVARHKVVFGDYWIAIAKKYGVRLQDLYTVNNAGPTTPLKVGGYLNIPGKRNG
jgi:LysM repeat protein